MTTREATSGAGDTGASRAGRRAWLVGLAGVITAAGAAVLVEAQPPGVGGTIESIDTAARRLVFATADGPRSGQYTDRTRVTAGGMPADVRDLRPGQRCRVTFAVGAAGGTRAEIVAIDLLLGRR